jgi:hypothetical protein
VDLRVNSTVGATRYCDQNGLNCFTPSQVSGFSTSTSGITGLGVANNLAIWTSPTNLTYKSLGDLQNRVTGTCSGNSAIRQINADGSVACATNPGTCVYGGEGYSTGATICAQKGVKATCKSGGNWDNSADTSCSTATSIGVSASANAPCVLDDKQYSNGYSSCSYKSATQSTKATCSNGSWTYQTVSTSSC